MTVLRAIARPMLASMFVYGGVSALREPGRRAEKAQPVADAVTRAGLPVDAGALVRANAVVHVVAGLGLATGRLPRLSALALAATMPPTTYAGHQFWAEPDPAQRTNQTIHFLKNVAMTGGLLMSVVDPEPRKVGVTRRATQRAARAGRSLRRSDDA